MSDQTNGTAPTQQPEPADYRQFMELLININAQLQRLSDRMDAAEQRAAAYETRAAANEARAAEMDNRIAANNIRITAMFKNLDRRAKNAACFRCWQTPATPLLPLVNLTTGQEIIGSPATVEQLSRIDEAATRNILDALQIEHYNHDAAGARELLRFYTMYAST
ncbi:hypothetical protein TsFJ059_003257 [Trichoderma semiorbis]|uniref:Uncharacterized protein n=1 Tax=Trichoderma semiorbis TaxID=1491008 RepID=A0A9P8KNX9_9HYPO|nr:hypothetical protein TsFJ059_003257 [Trichoderma semiorbis]